MPNPPTHYVSIYDNPLAASGTGRVFQGRFLAYNYTHSHSWIGGYDSMACDILCDRQTAEIIYENYLGSRIAAFVDNPDFIWEGFINRVTYVPGNREFTRAFDDMANRVRVLYNISTTGVTSGVTTVVNNTTSQNLYGIKDAVYDTDINYGANITHKDDVRTLKLALNAYPLVSSKESSGAALLRLECLGFYWLWDWVVYEAATTNDRNADIAFRRRTVNTAGSAPANSDKIYRTGSGTGIWDNLIMANAAFTFNDESTSGTTYLEQLQAILEGGDGSARWVAGITPLDHLNSSAGNERYVYYRPANTSIAYRAKALSEPGIIRDQYGRQVDPWRVQADNTVRITDVLVGYDDPGDDPRQTYIESISYNAESLQVSYQGIDNTTMQGAFGLTQRYRKHGRRLKDAPIRVRL